MGGERISIADDEESSSEQKFPDHFEGLSTSFRMDGLIRGLDEDKESGFRESGYVGNEFSSTTLKMDANERQRRNAYTQVLRSYDELQSRIELLEEAKSKILGYTPGAWMGTVGGMKSSDFDLPKTTTLLLIGPKGSGKSSLVNRISRVFEEDKFASQRAQVSYNSPIEDGTYFLQEYMIPRCSTSFCLYDTRSLSKSSSENMKLLNHWMTKGVCHGQLIRRGSDSLNLRTKMKCKARQSNFRSSGSRTVNFVIFVVNGLSVLESLDTNGDAEAGYTNLVATVLNLPFLSFKDDKPVVVITHGDLLSLSDRARIRVHLGELLGIPPDTQIFDIPDTCDQTTELTIVEMLHYSLEHADRNLPGKGWLNKRKLQVYVAPLPAHALLVLIVGIAIVAIITAWFRGTVSYANRAHAHAPVCSPAPEPRLDIDWHAIRHLWLG